MSNIAEIAHTRNNALQFFQTYVAHHKAQLKNKVVIDVSAGTGYIAHLFEETGAVVKLYDLFPEENKYATAKCERIDLLKELPIESHTADLVICSETIEHLPNQHFFFSEVSRILKTDGHFILTTPNSSSLRSRFSQFIMESEHYSNPAPNELNAFVSWDGSHNGYFNKLFISGVLRLRTLAALNKLNLTKIHRTPYSSTSIFLILFFPAVYYFSWRAYRKQTRLDPANQSVYLSIFKINTSLKVLLSKHLIMEFRKFN